MTFVAETIHALSLITPHMVGNEIRRLRVAANMRQADLAAAAHVSRHWIVKVESGHPGAELGRLMSVVRALDASMFLSQNNDSGQ